MRSRHAGTTCLQQPARNPPPPSTSLCLPQGSERTMGMMAVASAAATISWLTPCFSLPSTKAVGRVQSTSCDSE